MTAILGLSAFYHDSAAALVVDGEIVAAAQEERFTRKKHDSDFPINAVQYCLREAGLSADDLDYVGFYDKPLLKFDRLLETYLAFAPLGFQSFVKAMPLWLKYKLHLPREIRKALGGAYKKQIVFSEHHESHAASAFFPSPFEEAAILTLDGVGEWASASYGAGRGNKIQLTHEQHFPHSLGLLYSAFTYYCGFKVNGGEYKLMGLAPYGEPTYYDLILEKLLDLKKDGSFRLDLSYFNFCHGLTMTGQRFHDLFGGPPRKTDSEIPQKMMDIAASIQKVTEEVMMRCARHAHKQTGLKNLCLAGGVALNCVGNGRILAEGPFENIWIQPAADDAGGALGVALLIWHQLLNRPRVAQPTDNQRGSLLGPAFSDDEIERFLKTTSAPFTKYADDQTLCDEVAQAMADGKVIGWFQGRMEFGPRALGSRSILGDPRAPKMQTIMNVKVKFREGFRPFAPAVLESHTTDYFAMKTSVSPYMLLVAPVQEAKRRDLKETELGLKGIDMLKQHRSEIPAVTHVDYSARVQTVSHERNGIYHTLIESFFKKTGCPVIVNTSFNLGWDPIVCAPKDAFDTFMACDIDVLCMGRFVLTKEAQPSHVAEGDVQRRDAVIERLALSPVAGGELRFEGDKATCRDSGQVFERRAGVWNLFSDDTAGKDVGSGGSADALSVEQPTPTYDRHESIRSLIEASRKGQYTRALDRAIPYNTTVLEVGCGTGQVSNFLGVSCRTVVGTDLCLKSLGLAERFRSAQSLERVNFVRMNPLRPCLRKGAFDVILVHGAVHAHHPREALAKLLPLMKPGGHIVLGLSNKYGHLLSGLAGLLGAEARSADPIVRAQQESAERRQQALTGQQGSGRHTIGEVLEWFDAAGLEFVRGVPAVTPGPDPLDGVDLFAPMPRGAAVDHLVVQAERVYASARDGGFFLMIGRKPMDAARAEQAPSKPSADLPDTASRHDASEPKEARLSA